jgi:hypothetical protein
MVNEPRTRRAPRRLVKIVVALAAVGAVGFLLTRSMKSARAKPYSLDAASLRNWSVGLYTAVNPRDPVLVLQPPPGLPGRLFDEVFGRVMESMRAPPVAGIPLLVRDEVDRAFRGRVTDEMLLAAARSAGLGSVTVSPRCMAYRRVSDSRVAQQAYFILFDMPELVRFREQVGTSLGAGPGWDPAALSPVMFVALADSTMDRWFPLRADPARDCQAPIVVSP